MTYEKKYKWTLAGLIVMIALNAITLIVIWSNSPESNEWSEQEIGKEEFRDRGYARNYMQDRLGLNRSQADSISSIRRNHFREMRVMREELESLRRSYFDSLMQGSVDEAALESMAQEMAGKSAAIEQSMSEHMIELNKYLNVEQRREFGRMMQDMVQHDRRRGENRQYRHRQN